MHMGSRNRVTADVIVTSGPGLNNPPPLQMLPSIFPRFPPRTAIGLRSRSSSRSARNFKRHAGNVDGNRAEKEEEGENRETS